MRTKVRGQAQQVREYACRRDFVTRARTLHDQGIVAITLGGEAHDVIGERDVGEGVLRIELRQPDGRLAVRR